MKKIVTFGVIAGAALTLAACQGEAPAEEAPAEETEAAPVEDLGGEGGMTDEDAAALDAAAAAAEGTETNTNPILPSAPEAEASVE